MYGHFVCKKCFYAFANRRQLGYLVDALLVGVVNFFANYALADYLGRTGSTTLAVQFVVLPMNLLLMCLFILKDGFGGQSPGKRLTDVRALDEATGQPIGFRQSFKRNSVLLFGLIPIIGGLISLGILITIATQVAGGYRLGDRFAKTKVIWKRYANSPVFGGDALACEQCGYELRGNVSGICPECGTAISPQNLQRLATENATAVT